MNSLYPAFYSGDETGTVVMRVPEPFLQQIKGGECGELEEEMMALACHVSMDDGPIYNLDCRVGEVMIDNGYAMFYFNNSDWGKVIELFVKLASGIELYAKNVDEYGCIRFFALGPHGERLAFFADINGDEIDNDDGYEDRLRSHFNQWRELLPNEALKFNPNFDIELY